MDVGVPFHHDRKEVRRPRFSPRGYTVIRRAVISGGRGWRYPREINTSRSDMQVHQVINNPGL
jgi:hypothetical protein